MPSSRYIDLTLGASGSTYTAPANGWFFFFFSMKKWNYAIKALDGYSQCYVFFLVKSVVERLIKKSNGAVFSAITSKDFDEEILIPSQKAVEDFTNVIDGFFRRIFTIGTENSRLSLLRDTLLPRLMSGELEVPE